MHDARYHGGNGEAKICWQEAKADEESKGIHSRDIERRAYAASDVASSIDAAITVFIGFNADLIRVRTQVSQFADYFVRLFREFIIYSLLRRCLTALIIDAIKIHGWTLHWRTDSRYTSPRRITYRILNCMTNTSGRLISGRNLIKVQLISVKSVLIRKINQI